MAKIKIVIEDKKKGIIEIPISLNEIDALYHVGYMGGEDLFETLKLNKMDKAFWKMITKFEHIIYDIYSGGKWYSLNNKTNKMKFSSIRYMVKKPKWKKK